MAGSISDPSAILHPNPGGPISVVLPSIHDMFPEHLMGRPWYPRLETPPFQVPTRNRFQHSQHIPAPSPPTSAPNFSFDVLISHPREASLTHIASSRATVDVHPVRDPQAHHNMGTHSLTHSVAGSSDGEEMDNDANEEEDGNAGRRKSKKHVCATCAKGFNRPSSLQIHMNTHTGAKPFRCPHPGCTRAFNVNSNMRRHWRNHTSQSRWVSSSNSDSSSNNFAISPTVSLGHCSPPRPTRGISLSTSGCSSSTALPPLAFSTLALPADNNPWGRPPSQDI
ncbi:hypothetical protein DFH06DRAFT_1083685 [Mycena polygramma]|nr:hypothetical protein DFH06DRAFT_1083685 [Mycena polygramma]